MVDMERRRELAVSLEKVLHSPMRRATDPALVRALQEKEALQRRQQLLTGVLVMGLVVLAWLWVARPAAVFDPLGPPVSSGPQDAEAAMRYGLYLQASRIGEFQAEHGRVPGTLAEVGEVEEGLDYLPDTASWTLRGQVGELVLELTSRMSVDSFLGDAMARLRP